MDVAARMVELARQQGDDQTFFPSFAAAAWLLARTGRTVEADELVDELLERRRANPTGVMAGWWTAYTALTLNAIGRQGELVALDEPEGSRFLGAALAIDEARFADAARTLEAMGAPLLEAETHVLAARALPDAGDVGDGETELSRARALLGELGATARLAELSREQVSD